MATDAAVVRGHAWHMHTSSADATFLSRRSRFAIAVAAGATMLFAGACSSGAEITPTTAAPEPAAAVAVSTDDAATTTEVAQAADNTATPSADCIALHEARVGIQGAGGTLIYAEDADFVSEFIGGPDAVTELLGDVDTLRPYQDVDARSLWPNT